MSHRLWQQRLGADPGIVGRSITLNGSVYTIIGVAPQGFAGAVLGNVPDAWVPMALQADVRPPSAGSLRQRLGSSNMLGVREVRWLNVVGRLKPAPLSQRAQPHSRSWAAASPPRTAIRIAISAPPPFRSTKVPVPAMRARPVLTLLTVAVSLVLLIACANVASLWW